VKNQAILTEFETNEIGVMEFFIQNITVRLTHSTLMEIVIFDFTVPEGGFQRTPIPGENNYIGSGSLIPVNRLITIDKTPGTRMITNFGFGILGAPDPIFQTFFTIDDFTFTTETFDLSALITLCPTCHRIAHSCMDVPLSIEEIRSKLEIKS